MSLIKIDDVAHVRFCAPDLRSMAEFLTDFGLESWLGEDGILYGRGSDGAPFLHATECGPPGFMALGLRAESVDDLERLAQADGVTVDSLDAPGGGHVVRLMDPDGFRVEVVAGQARAPAQPPLGEPARNAVGARARYRQALRLEAGPSHVRRLGHCVLGVSDFRASERWYKDRFGFITSDEIEATGGIAVGAFMRCDRGDVPTDHHSLFLAQLPRRPGFMHAAFEVANLDDLMLGHAHLKARGREPAWGVGRHVLGSQVFDYWKDPWGFELEHWTDGDLLSADVPPNRNSFDALLAVQWGTPHPLTLAQTTGDKA